MGSRREGPLALLEGIAVLVAFPAASLAGSGSVFQVDPSETVVMIQKDVGRERWTIVYDRERKTYLGNVLKDDGSTPSFVWCETVSESEIDVTFRCEGSDPCVSSTCPGRRPDGGEDWILISEEFTLPWSFLDPSRRDIPSGSPDPTFGDEGTSLVPIGGAVSVFPRGVHVGGDGSVRLLVFAQTDPADEARRLQLVGLQPDGRPDVGIGPGGRRVLLPEESLVQTAAFSPDGGILVATGPAEAPALAWLDPDGVLDSSFGRGGFASLRIARVWDLHVLDGGEILVVGEVSAEASNEPSAGMEKLSPTGRTQSSFGDRGIAFAPPPLQASPSFLEEPFRFHFVGVSDAGDRLLVHGFHQAPLSRIGAIFVYDRRGRLDGSFGEGGFVLSENWGSSQIVPEPDGSMLLLTRFAVRRHFADGSFDDGFDPLLSVAGNGILRIARGPAGRIFAVGSAFVPFTMGPFCSGAPDRNCVWDVPVVQSFQPDGSASPGFGKEGTLTLEPPAPYRAAQGSAFRAVTLAPPDRLTIAGTFCRAPRDCDLAVVRYGR